MSEPPVSPDSDFVYSLFTGVYKTQSVHIALTLDVFTPLANGPADAQVVGQACGCSPSGVHFLLDYLSNIGVLERQANKYALTPTQWFRSTVINASLAADGNGERITAEGLANIYAHPIHWDPQQDTLLVEVDGTLIGYASTEWREEDGGDCLLDDLINQLLPDHLCLV